MSPGFKAAEFFQNPKLECFSINSTQTVNVLTVKSAS